MKIKGPADVIVARSQSVQAEDFGYGRTISLNVLYGNASILAAHYDNEDSIFVVVAPNSVGVAESTMFGVSVDRESNTVWDAYEGFVRVATVTGDNQEDTVVALTPLSPYEALFIPSISIESHPEITEDEIVTIIRDMAQQSSAEHQSNIKMKKVTLIDKDLENDFAVYGITGLTIPAIISSIPGIPFGYEILDFKLLQHYTQNQPSCRLFPPPNIFLSEKTR